MYATSFDGCCHSVDGTVEVGRRSAAECLGDDDAVKVIEIKRELRGNKHAQRSYSHMLALATRAKVKTLLL